MRASVSFYFWPQAYPEFYYEGGSRGRTQDFSKGGSAMRFGGRNKVPPVTETKRTNFNDHQ